jgi:probable HAF family extracellular repeat protein
MGKIKDLRGLGGTCGVPYWINNHGQVVGFSDLAGDKASHPFLWTKANRMQDLGTLGGHFGTASMINELGDIVGGSTLEGDSQIDAFLWRNGKINDLGALDGCSYAFSINARRQVVGNWGGAQCAEGAFLWEDGGPMVDLSTLIVPHTSLTLGVTNINDRGEIVGVGLHPDDKGHAILLIPCDENHPGIEGCDYSFVEPVPDDPAPSF